MIRPFFILLSILLLLAWSPNLYAQYGTGCTLDAEKYRQVPLAAAPDRNTLAKLPARVSLRKYAPTPQNQGSLGTCVGWSTAYAARTIMMAHQQNWENEQVLITENAFSPFFVYEQAKPSRDIFCQEGTSLYNALEIIKDVGAVKVQDFASQCGQVITPAHQAKATKYRIKEYQRLFDSDANDKIQRIRRSIAAAKPVVVGIECCDESFLNAKGQKFWKSTPGKQSKMEGGHALTVIGYDDDMQGGAVELMNSWGNTWGDEGFIWMAYEDFAHYCFEAYEMHIEEFSSPSLSGSVNLELSSGKQMQVEYKENESFNYYEIAEPYHSGTLFRLKIKNTQPAYVYAFGTDLTGKTYPILPNRPENSAFLMHQDYEISIPNEYEYIGLDNNPGKEFFFILYSRDEIDFKKVLKKMENASGTSIEKMTQVLGDRLISPQEVRYYQRSGVGFTAYPDKNQIIPVMLAIEHID